MTMTHIRPEPPSVRAHLAELTPITHGGLSWEELLELGLDPDDVTDLSSNVHPYGPPPSVEAAIRGANIERYPEPTARSMREAIAVHLGTSPEQVVAGNGSIELIYLLAQVYLGSGDTALILGPTFGEYASAIRFCGARVVEYRARAANSFRPNLDAVLAMIQEHRPRLVFCCNPNNPTGQVLGESELHALLEAVAGNGGMLVLDEAYRALADDDVLDWDSLKLLTSGPSVLLRSMTKDYALPGLRLGYAVAPPAVGRALNALRIPWSVNVFAETVGRDLLRERAYLARCRARLAQDKVYLQGALDGISARRVPSAVNYALIHIASGTRSAADCRRALLRYGVLVRDCTNFGLPDFIRVRVHEPAATVRLVDGLRDWQQGR